MDLAQLQEVILGTIDDDWYGLWEVDWAFNSAGVPTDFTMRSGVLTTLVLQGNVELRFGRLGSGDPIEIEQAIKAISIPENWAPPTSRDQPVYFVGEKSEARA